MVVLYLSQSLTSPLQQRLNDISSLDTLVLDFQVEQTYQPESMGDGNQTVTSLRGFPRVRQLGDTQLQVYLSFIQCNHTASCLKPVRAEIITPALLLAMEFRFLALVQSQYLNQHLRNHPRPAAGYAAVQRYT